jgi:hypothetical protein
MVDEMTEYLSLMEEIDGHRILVENLKPNRL